jgi:hypothetical protein
MTRARAWTGAVIFAAALVGALMIPQITTAQQERSCADRARPVQAITLARRINSAESNSRTGIQPLSAFPDIAVPDGLNVQFLSSGSGYVFSIKDNQDPCHSTVFSDQEQIIYTAQPLQPSR